MNATLLFVEPDPFFRSIYERLFRAEGFDVVCAAHGERVVDLVKQVQPRAILMALALPRKAKRRNITLVCSQSGTATVSRGSAGARTSGSRRKDGAVEPSSHSTWRFRAP